MKHIKAPGWGRNDGFLIEDTDLWLTSWNHTVMLKHSLCNNISKDLSSIDYVPKEEENTLGIHKNNIRKNMSQLKLVSSDGGSPTGNWLLDLPIGTRFAVQALDNPKNFMCLSLELVSKTSHTAILYELSSGMPLGGTDGRVVASRFASLFSKVETLPHYEEMLREELDNKKETSNGESDRSVGLEPEGQGSNVVPSPGTA